MFEKRQSQKNQGTIFTCGDSRQVELKFVIDVVIEVVANFL